uniref:Ubiquitin-like protease family profile domain-containing protein n=1 Tax=Chenopodium quinoa TaxID=63459 RepID=A0A803LIQ0_CHEQI
MGTTITRDEIHSLIEDKHMLNNVVDAYVCLLNFENKRRGVDKKSRFFFSTECYLICCTEKYFKSNERQDDRMKALFDRMQQEMTTTEVTSFKSIQLLNAFADFVHSIDSNIKSDFVSSFKTRNLSMSWKSNKNKHDCGVFLLKHMETYEGESVKQWNSGLELDNNGKRGEREREQRANGLSTKENDLLRRIDRSGDDAGESPDGHPAVGKGVQGNRERPEEQGKYGAWMLVQRPQRKIAPKSKPHQGKKNRIIILRLLSIILVTMEGEEMEVEDLILERNNTYVVVDENLDVNDSVMDKSVVNLGEDENLGKNKGENFFIQGNMEGNMVSDEMEDDSVIGLGSSLDLVNKKIEENISDQNKYNLLVKDIANKSFNQDTILNKNKSPLQLNNIVNNLDPIDSSKEPNFSKISYSASGKENLIEIATSTPSVLRGERVSSSVGNDDALPSTNYIGYKDSQGIRNIHRLPDGGVDLGVCTSYGEQDGNGGEYLSTSSVQPGRDVGEVSSSVRDGWSNEGVARCLPKHDA